MAVSLRNPRAALYDLDMRVNDAPRSLRTRIQDQTIDLLATLFLMDTIIQTSMILNISNFVVFLPTLLAILNYIQRMIAERLITVSNYGRAYNMDALFDLHRGTFASAQLQATIVPLLGCIFILPGHAIIDPSMRHCLRDWIVFTSSIILTSWISCLIIYVALILIAAGRRGTNRAQVVADLAASPLMKISTVLVLVCVSLAIFPLKNDYLFVPVVLACIPLGLCPLWTHITHGSLYERQFLQRSWESILFAMCGSISLGVSHRSWVMTPRSHGHLSPGIFAIARLHESLYLLNVCQLTTELWRRSVLRSYRRKSAAEHFRDYYCVCSVLLVSVREHLLEEEAASSPIVDLLSVGLLLGQICVAVSFCLSNIKERVSSRRSKLQPNAGLLTDFTQIYRSGPVREI